MENASLLVDRQVQAGAGAKPAFVAASETVTYEQLLGRASRMGHLLRELGVCREQRVLIALDDTCLFPVVFLGAMRIGAVPVPVSPHDTEENFRYFVEDSYAEVAVCEAQALPRLRSAAGARLRCLVSGAPSDGAIELEPALAAQEDELAALATHREDMAFWLYSSGTTGMPKGVVHAHRNVEAIAETFGRQVLGLSSSDRLFATSKLHHAYALGNSFWFSLYFGASAVLLGGPPRPERLLGALREHRPSVLFSVPALYGLLAEDAGAEGALDSVRLCFSASAPLAPVTYERWLERFGTEIVEGIGSTEMLSTYCSNRPGACLPGSTGRAVPGYEIRLTGESGEAIEGTATGTLEVRGESCASSYWHQRGRAKDSMRGEWFATGDRFERRSDGAYVYVGRVDEMLKVGGLWVSPPDMERVLREHPAVLDAGVVGVGIDNHTRIVAVVQQGDHDGGKDRLDHDLREWCRARMRDYEYPHLVMFATELPRTLTGKLRRYQLLADVEAALESSEADGERVSGDLARDQSGMGGAAAPENSEATEKPPVDRGGVGAADPLADQGALLVRMGEAATHERTRVALGFVREQTAALLGHLTPEQIDPKRAFKELGFDSVAAVELRNRLGAAAGLQFPSTLAFDYPTPVELARYLRRRIEGARVAPVSRARTRAEREEPIAIVGMSCRYPGGASSPDALWKLLAAQADVVSGFPDDRGWDLGRLYDPDPDRLGSFYALGGGFLYDAAEFDAAFFGISPREAMTMDPQQRLLLEASWEAIEDAGVDPASLRGTDTGVYAGVMYQDYGLALSLSAAGGEAEGYALVGSSASVASGRIAYTLGLEGPAVTVDTACSSSLVTLHLACAAVRSGECSLALAGGVAVMATPGTLIEYSRQRGLARDGRCKSFAAAADGTGFSEGLGLVLLERLSSARSQGHRVLAVVRGSALNQDGASNGLTAPRGAAQEQVIRQALANAQLTPADVDVVEGHGTGTRLGDPIEAQALLATYGRERGGRGPLWLGSVKSNIGHTQAAAGVAGVIKMVKAFEHGVLPRTLHVDEPSCEVDWSSGGVSLLCEEAPWARGEDGVPRRAGVSSFGVSGTNAHVILEEAPREDVSVGRDLSVGVGVSGVGVSVGVGLGSVGVPALAAGGVVPWVLSGRGVEGLRGQAERLVGFLADGVEGAGVGDVGLSLACRSQFQDRAVVLSDCWDGLLAGVAALADGTPGVGVVSGVVPDGDLGGPVFVFAGQGSQWAGMGVGLLDQSPVFARCLDECDRALSRYVDWSVEDVLRGVEGAPGFDRVDVVQPVLFCVMVALAGLWRACGVEPAAVVGHSQGEIAAACVAGGLSLEDAARIVALRGRVLLGLSGLGGMLSVAEGVDDLAARIERWDGRVSVAAVNGVASVVLSGEPVALGEVLRECEEDGVRARLIPVDYAAHSQQIDVVREELLAGCEGIEPRQGDVPFYSSVTGGELDTSRLDAEYWYRNLRETVRFDHATRSLLNDGHRIFIETGPHPVLNMAIQETSEPTPAKTNTPGEREDDDDGVLAIGSCHRDDGGLARFLTALGEAWVGGASVDWARVYAHSGAKHTTLPTYAFKRTRYWLTSTPSGPTVTTAVTQPRAPGEQAPSSSGVGEMRSALALRLAGRTDAERRAATIETVREQVALVLRHATDEAFNPKRAFRELGFDSLTAVELRNRLSAVTGLRLPATTIFDHPTIAAVTDYLLRRLDGSEPELEAANRLVAIDEPIAIVGMSCRYPGAASPRELWALLARGGDAISELPGDRGWDLERLYDPDSERPGTSYTRYGGFLEEATLFDAAFFGIGPREALAMDPQQRVLLEAAWEAFEDAELDPLDLRGSRTGVYAGISSSDYPTGLTVSPGDELTGYRLTGGASSVASGRIAYALGLEGPAVSIDTACSSSLVALHLACAALRSGECSLALASGVTVMSSPGAYVEFSAQRGLARDGRCKSFAAAADGIGWSEGVGALVLQRLSSARREGRRVLAVVRGSALNQDGASNGLTAPNGPSQQRVIVQALANSGLSASQVDVVEGHGTGTRLGDPIEAQALLATYGRERGGRGPLWLGSVKSNIGHTAASAGVAGVIKMVKAFEHGVLPRTLHVDEPSCEVDWSSGGVSLLCEEAPWARGEDGVPRRAGVSSFGVSGTNAHVILEEAPREDVSVGRDVSVGDGPVSVGEAQVLTSGLPMLAAGGVVPWVLSGRGVEGLRGQAERLVGFLADGVEGAGVGDVGLSLACRSQFQDRAVVLGDGWDGLLAGLDSLADGTPGVDLVRGVVPEGGVSGPVFVFAGQGSQWAGMGVKLLEESPVFADWLGECDRALSEFVDWSVLDVLREEEGAPGLDRVDVVQPVLFCVMVALAGLWRACGVEPVAVVGHSQGEIAAACVAGGLSLADAARIIALRGRLLLELSGLGGMLSVAESVEQVAVRIERWGERVSLAAVNSAGSVVLSGEPGALREVLSGCEADGVRARLIAVDYAAHSEPVEAVREQLLDGCEGIQPRSGEVPFYSSVTGGELDTSLLDAEYWYRNLRETVRFDHATRSLLEAGHRVFIETGPHPVLNLAIQENNDNALAPRDASQTFVCGSMRREQGGAERFVTALAEAWVHGVPVDWRALLAANGAERIDLPRYAFQRERYWLAPAQSTRNRLGGGIVALAHPLLDSAVDLAGEDGWILTGALSLQSHPWLADHAVAGTVLLPGTAFLELALYAGAHAGAAEVEELVLEAALPIDCDALTQLQVSLGSADETGRRSVSIHSRRVDAGAEATDENDWTLHASGVLACLGRAGEDNPAWEQAVALGAAWPPAGAEPLDVGEFYERLLELGLEYGPAFQGLKAAWRYQGGVLAEVGLPDDHAADARSFAVHPALLDAALHAAGLTMPDGPGVALTAPEAGASDTNAVRLPFVWTGVGLSASASLRLRVGLFPLGEGAISLVAADEAGRPVAVVESLLSRPVAPDRLPGARAGSSESLLEVTWEPISPADARPSEPGEWVVLGSEESRLAGDLRAEGSKVVAYEDPDALVAAVVSGRVLPEGVLLEAPAGAAGGELEPLAMPERVSRSVCEILPVLQRWLTEERLASCRLAVLTREAQPAGGGDAVAGLATSAAWGLLRSAQSEHPGRFLVIDVGQRLREDSDDRQDDCRGGAFGSLLLAALGSGEPQIALREGELLVPRIRRSPSADSLAIPEGVGDGWRLDSGRAGTLEDLSLVPCEDTNRPLRPGEVRVATRAAGLNFRDVLLALGMNVGDAAIGGEMAGVVLEVAPGVGDLAPGDRVMGLCERGFSQISVADRRLVTRIPDGWTFARAASIPIAYLTAYYGLVDLAATRPGERVLIHAAAGGVGMAAVQIAMHLGAEVFATASPAKWPALTSLGLDDAHIASSRTLGFADDFLEQTGGAGVNVVLNSLSGDFVDASLALLTRDGRFLELGKTDVREPAGVLAGREDGSYRAFSMEQAGPDRIAEIFSELIGLFASGELQPSPVASWDIRRAGEAFRFMSKARHIGKIVLAFPARVGSDGTVLLTGGTGLLGGLLARHLVVEHGVRSLLLASRAGIAAAGAPALQEELESLGATVQVVACDVSDRDAVVDLLGRVPPELPLRGVVHAAGALDDGVIGSLTEESVAHVLAPKVAGAWHLHELTRGLDLSLFALFSSGAATMGASGQGNYAAANCFLDALAAHRRARGLAASSIAWGLWEQASGLTGGLADADTARMARQGVRPISSEEGLRLFDLAVCSQAPAVVAVQLDMAALRAQARTGLLPALMRDLVPATRGDARVGESFNGRLAAVPAAEREGAALELVRSQAAIVLGHASSAAVDPQRAFKDLGFDSLAAVELRNRLNAIAGVALPATVVFDHPNASILAERLLGELGDVEQRRVRVPGRNAPAQEDLVAIVGMSCRYPGGVRSPQELWQLVADGGDAISTFPTDRGWDVDGLFDPDPDRSGSSYVRHGGFIHDAAEFDAAFFDIGPREALAMDPQQRLLLEASWEAFEDAGIGPVSLRGSATGVFSGVSSIDYGAGAQLAPREVEGYLGKGLLGSVISGRVSYVFGLEGPAVTVDTACSSSLVAIHWACRSLRCGECSLALAAGVTVIATPRLFVEYSRQRALAPDGRCKSFSDSADGAGFSEGVGVVLLERVSDALRNGHPIMAIVRGSATNQDGASNGLTAPNGPSQERVIGQALASAGLSASDVDAVEGHGTGTTLGDPIEAGALLGAYGAERSDGRPLWLGSVKSNIGHTQAAAGVAGVIKMVKALEHGVLPKTLHMSEPSTGVDWSAGSVSLLAETQPWERGERVRRAAVSSFGISGTNAHLILEEAPAAIASEEPVDSVAPAVGAGAAKVLLWPLSARGSGGLRRQAVRLGDDLQDRGDLDPADVGLSLSARPALSDRAVVVGEDGEELRSGIEALAAGRQMAGVATGVAPSTRRVVFVFSGQGGQWEGMGRDLLRCSPVFAAEMRRCDEALSEYVEWSVLDVLGGVAGAPDGAGLDVLQPALFAVTISLAALWRACGVEPSAVVGHSQGEVAAAYVAGGLSLRDAARVSALRGRMLASIDHEGAVVSVALGLEEAQRRISRWSPRLSIASVNGPSTVGVAGDEEALEELLRTLEDDGVRARRVAGTPPSHCEKVERLRDEALDLFSPVSPLSGDVPFYSTVTGGPLDTAELDAGYWYENMRRQVRFQDAVEALLRSGSRLFVEVGPHPVLAVPLQETLDARLGGDGDGRVVGSLRRQDGDLRRFMCSLGEIWTAGAEVDWNAVFAGSGAEGVRLPTYAFARERFWLTSRADGADVRSVGVDRSDHPLLGAVLTRADGDGWLFTADVSLDRQPWLADHSVLGTTLFPGAAFLELALHAGRRVGCEVVHELVLEEPLALSPDASVRLQIAVGGVDEAGRCEFSVFSRVEHEETATEGERWTRNATGTLTSDGRAPVVDPLSEASARASDDGAAGAERNVPAPPWPPEAAVAVDIEDAYASFADLGLEYGPAFTGLTALWRTSDALFCEVSLPEPAAEDAGSYELHPALLDASLHAAAFVDGIVHTGEDELGDSGLSLPFSWHDVRLSQRGASELRVCLSRRSPSNGQGHPAPYLTATDPSGRPVASIGSLVARRISADALKVLDGARRSLFRLRWEELSGGSGDRAGERWTILGDEDSPLAVELREGGVEPIAFRDVRTLIDAHVAEGGLPVGTVLLDAREEPPLESESRHDALTPAVCGALGRLQEWLPEQALADCRLVVLTSNAQPVLATDDVSGLTGAGVWGLIRSAQAEDPGRIALVDIDGATSPLASLRAAIGSGETQLAVRDGVPYAPRLDRISRDLGDSSRGVCDDRLEVATGTVLITGGTGGLGALLARHMVSGLGARSLVLASRKGPDAEGAEDLQRQLEALGAEVEIVACDVAERSQVSALLERVPDEYPLRSVVHGAVALEDGVIGSLTGGGVERVMAPKALGAWHLHELTAGMDLSMFVLYSSAVGVLGAPGQGNYAAANAFLDALAAYRRAKGLPAVSIAWGLWDDPSGSTAGLNAIDRARISRVGIKGLSSSEGLDLFDAALDSGEAAVIAANLDVQALRAQARAGIAPSFLCAGTAPRITDDAPDESWRNRLLGASAPELGRIALELVQSEAAIVLGHSSAAAVESDRAFKELGLDSLAAVELRNRLNEATGLQIAATSAFEHPNPAALAEHLIEEIARERPSGASVVEQELAKLQDAIAGCSADDTVRGVVADRLRRLLVDLEQEPESGERAAALERIDVASDEEIFALLDSEATSSSPSQAGPIESD